MGRKKPQGVSESVDSTPQSGDELKEPEYFDPSLLKQSAAVRQRYFEDECIIEHPYSRKLSMKFSMPFALPAKNLI